MRSQQPSFWPQPLAESSAFAARLSHLVQSSNVVGQRLSPAKLKNASFMAGVAQGQKPRRVKLVLLLRTQYTAENPNRRGQNAPLPHAA